MSYGIEFEARAELEFYSWDLPLAVYEEIERRLEREVSEHPTQYLRNLKSAPGSLQYICRVVEEGSPPVVHLCLFRMRYSQDDENLIVWDCCHFPLRNG